MSDMQSINARLAEHVFATPSGSGVNVGVASTLVLASNGARHYASVVNDSDTVIYLMLGAAALVNQGIRINANGGSYEITWDNLYTGAIYGIHGGVGNKVVTVSEGA